MMPATLSSLTPARCRAILAAVLLAGFVGHWLYLAIDPPIELSGDEAHYWDWSRQLDWSYYSKGPAVACIIRASCALVGDTMLGVRMPALLLAVATSLCTYWLTRRVFGSDRLALGAVLLTHCVPMFVAGSMLMTIDPPFYFCWTAATCFGYLAVVERRSWAWPMVGVLVGLGFLAKYAMLLWYACLLCYGLFARDRRSLRTPWPYVALAITAVLTLPVVYWNQQHDWVTFGHVARSTTENQSHFNPLRIAGNFAQMLGGQIGILNPAVAALMVGAVVIAWRKTRALDPESSREGASLAYLLAMSLPVLVIVTLVTLFKEVQPNWPAPAYSALVPLTAWGVAVAWPRTKGWLVAAVMIGAVAMPVMHYSSALYPLISLPPRKWDPSFRLRLGAPETARVVTQELKTLSPGAFVLCDKYQTAALMAFYVEGQPKTYCIGSYIADPNERDRLTQHDMWPDRRLDQPSLVGCDAVFVGHEASDLFEAFEHVERLADVPVVRHGVVIRHQKLFRCRDFKGLRRPADGMTKR